MKKLMILWAVLLTVAVGYQFYSGFDTTGTESALNLGKDTGDTVTASDFDAIDTAVTDNDTRLDTIEAITGPVFSDGDGTYTDMSAISSTELNLLDGVTTLWHSGNDGAGTGLDADTVDGYNAVRTIASGTVALGTSEIASGACATVVTATASGVVTTDVIDWVFNQSVKAVMGYNPATGVLVIMPYPTANNVNFDVCNLTAGAITPAAVTLNWKVQR